ncbi:hypothetical protein A1O3_04205 [Capronia epimyces CBS 606.96]|uniref:Very-long-chain 3-oxoacyl-CoA synthase n=1 Tax=Capronia epimyces CBS 606.96 TaxID=1182542 RepID=W9YDA6_9EURO|nr:uncharacterized protein A1O3_04205 [Capronia epimyces CBS 606.96]EXJ87246.1 hypothetical protein A1O3_04205 [Capronia epimyces CBS 606.96]
MTVEGKPLTSLQGVILTTAPFLFLWSTLRGHVERHGAFAVARTLIRLNSQIYVLFSLALTLLDPQRRVADPSIGSYVAFHHLTTPFLTYFRVLNAVDWQLFAFLNCFHHFFMYAYFGGVSVFRPILPLTGWLRLGAAISLDA